MGTPASLAHVQTGNAWPGDIRSAQEAGFFSLGQCNTRSMSYTIRPGAIPNPRNPRYARAKHKQLARQRPLGFACRMTEQGR
jgi:hypothetical protein